MADLTPEMQAKLAAFNPSKPLIINAAEIPGLESYVGSFQFRRPNNADRIKIAIRTAKIKENVELDIFHENLAFILATFDVVCTQKPIGVNFEELFDADPIFALYSRYTEWQEMFRLRVQATQTTSSEAK